METSKVAPMVQEAEITLGKTCRICMEGELDSTPLLSPCKCSGTIRYIHEECLKTWLVSHTEDISESCCELCKTPFSMEFKMRHKCTPRQSCKGGVNSCMFVPVLIAIVIILFIIVYLLADRYLSTDSGDEEKGYTIALIITCALSALILSILIFSSLKEACFIPQLEDWRIYSQNFEEEEDSVEIRVDDWPAAQVIVVPETTKVAGVRVKTPILKPVLRMVKKLGNVMAYTPQCLSPNLSLCRETPVHNAAATDNMKIRSRSPFAAYSVGYKSIPDDSLNYI